MDTVTSGLLDIYQQLLGESLMALAFFALGRPAPKAVEGH